MGEKRAIASNFQLLGKGTLPETDDMWDDDYTSLDPDDLDDNDEFVCNDDDGDTCDECSSGTYDGFNDGADNEGDSICEILLHDNNLNIVGRAVLAQPVVKKLTDKYLFRIKMDY